MTAMTHDTAVGVRAQRTAAGLGFALLSAASFGLAGAVARGLTDSGWTPGSAVLVRVGIAAVVLLVPAALQLRGRWGALRTNARLIVTYGITAVAITQVCFFYAVQHMQVGPALLVEYAAPVAVVCWMWFRHGQRPGRLTVLGAVVCAVGLLLVLDVVSGAEVSPVGIGWALVAMLGMATYFILSGSPAHGLPPLALAASGLVVGTVVLALCGVVGLLPMTWSTAPASYAVGSAPWWTPVLVLGVVTAGIAYGTGIAAVRRLGSRLASFVGLSEVLVALVAAWLLLAEVPGPVQLVGAVLVVVGVVLVRLGEGRVSGRPGE